MLCMTRALGTQRVQQTFLGVQNDLARPRVVVSPVGANGDYISVKSLQMTDFMAPSLKPHRMKALTS